jgi:hypothetical protein
VSRRRKREEKASGGPSERTDNDLPFELERGRDEAVAMMTTPLEMPFGRNRTAIITGLIPHSRWKSSEKMTWKRNFPEDIEPDDHHQKMCTL